MLVGESLKLTEAYMRLMKHQYSPVVILPFSLAQVKRIVAHYTILHPKQIFISPVQSTDQRERRAGTSS